MRSVLKFGGSSVADLDKMRAIAERLKGRKESGDELVVVVSAMGKTTNSLVKMAMEAAKHPSKRELDMILSTGEQISIALLSMILNEMGVSAVSLTGYQAGILTEGMHTKTRIKEIDTTTVERHLAEGKVVVVAGFQGYNEKGEITTLGRGGSDTTAVALAAMLHCPCEIYTDVDGIYGVDPKLYSKAKKLDSITYEEMKEMAFLGAKVMEPRSVDIAQTYGVVIQVGSAVGTERGTYINGGDANMEQRSITGLSIAENIMMVTIRNLEGISESVAEVFSRLAAEEINIDMISQIPNEDGSVSLSFTASSDDMENIRQVLNALFAGNAGVAMDIEKDLIKISVVGSGMRTQTGVAARLFRLLAENHLEFKQVTTSEISISYTMEKKFRDQTVNLIADQFNL